MLSPASVTESLYGPLVKWLTREIFNLQAGVQFSYGLPLNQEVISLSIQGRINSHRQLDRVLLRKETAIVEEITKLIVAFYRSPERGDWKALYSTALDLIYISLKQTCSLTAETIPKIYDIEQYEGGEFTKEKIDKYTYNKDGLSLSKRVERAINKAESSIFTEHNRDILIFNLTRILDNETLVVSHKLTRAIMLEEKVEYAMIAGGNGCGRECCTGIDTGWHPIDEIDDPPYHPNCQCILVYLDPEEDDEPL